MNLVYIFLFFLLNMLVWHCCQHFKGSDHETVHLLLWRNTSSFLCYLILSEWNCIKLLVFVSPSVCFLTCTCNARTRMTPKLKDKMSAFIWIHFYTPKMKHWIKFQVKCTDAFQLFRDMMLLWKIDRFSLHLQPVVDPAMKKNDHQQLCSVTISCWSLYTLSKDLWLYSMAEKEGLYNCCLCWV